MVEGGRSGSGGQSGSSTSSHSSSSSSSSKSRDTRLLLRVSPSVQSERIHSFFDRSLSLAKPPIGAGFVKKVYRKSSDKVILSIEDASIARRLVSSFSDSHPKIDGHEFTIEFYSSDHSKSLSSPSNHNGDKRKELSRMSSCTSEPSPSSSSKRPSHSSPSTSRPSTSTNDSIRNECLPSSSSFIPMDPYEGIIGVAMHKLPFISESILKEILSAGLREIGGYLTHFTEDSGRMKVLLKRNVHVEETPEEKIRVQGEEVHFTTLPSEETRNLYDQYLMNEKSRSSIPSSSSSSSHSCRSPFTRDPMSYDSSRTVFIPCLPKGVTKEYFRKRFHKIGSILDVELKNINSVSPHAIVEFAHTQAAVMAMEDYEREQKEEGEKNPLRNKKRPHFIRSPSSIRVWVANLPFQEEDYVKKKLLELLKGAANPTIVTDLRRREGIIDFASQEKAKHYLEVIKSSPLLQQSGQVQTWLVADYCSEELYTHFRDRRGINPSAVEVEYVSILSKRIMTDTQRDEANARMDKMKGGDEKPIEKKSMNGENGNHVHSPTASRRSNAEDRRSGDSGFSEDREKIVALDSDDDEVLEAKWTKAAVPIDRSEENGKLRERLMKMGDAMEAFYKSVPQKEKKGKKEVEEEGRENTEKIPREERMNYFRDALLNVTTPLKARSMDEMGGYRGNPLRSPPIPISPLNGGDKRHTVRSPPSGSRPAPLHINIPPSTSTAHSNTIHSPYTRLPSTSTSRHPSISTPSTLTPRSQTMPSTINRPPFPIESNGDHGWNGVGGATGSHSGTPTSSRVPLSRRESVCSNSSQSHTPLPPSTSGGVFTPTPLKSPPLSTWNPTGNAWKGGPSLSSPNPSSINRSRSSIDSHHKPSTSSISRPALPALPKSNLDKSGFGHISHPKTPSLPRSTSMNEKKPSRDPSKDFNLIQKNGPDVKKMPRIPKKENRERDEKDERREKKREEKDRERREERREKKEDRKKSRENESKEEKARRKELKRKEREKEDRKKSTNEKEKKKKNTDGEKKKKKKQSRTLSDSADSDFDSDESLGFKPSSSSKQMMDDEALARSLAVSSMYDRVKVRRSGSNREEKKKIDALEAIRKKKKKEMKTKKRAHLSSSSEEEEEVKESGKKSKKEEEEESSDGEEEERRVQKKKEKKREKERRDSSDESDSDDEREKKRKKKEKKVSKKNSLLDLFSDKDDVDSVKSEKKEKLSKKRSYEKERDDSPSSSSRPPPGKKVKKEESSSSASESEGERSSKKSEVSSNSWREREDKIRRLSESSVATEKDESWKSPASGSVEKEIKEEPKEDPPLPRLMTKAAMKEFGGGASSSPAGINWNKDESRRDLNLSSDSSQSSSEWEEEKEEEREERKEEDDNMREDERNDEEKMEEENEGRKEEEEEIIEEKKEDERMEEEKEEEVKMEVDENRSMENDEEAESAVRGLESPSDDVIEETEKAVESIFDEEEEPEARYPSNDFLNPCDMNLSSSSSQCSSPKILPSSSNLLHRPTPLHPHSISSPSPLHSHLLQSHSIPPPISSPLISPHLISPSGSRPSSIHQYHVRPISQESSSQHLPDDNGVIVHQENVGSSSDGLSPSPNQHPMMNKEEIIKKFPVKWQGKLKMKQRNTSTTWLKLHGEEGLLDTFFNSAVASLELNGESALVIEVNKKMRLDNDKIKELTLSMENGEEHACLIATPAGATQDLVRESRDVFIRFFVSQFRSKGIAGITEFTAPDGQQYVGQFFAPGQFVTDYLSPKYPDFLDLLNTKYSDAFLLVLLKRKEE